MMTATNTDKKPLPVLQMDEIERVQQQAKAVKKKAPTKSTVRRLTRRTLGIDAELDKRLRYIANLERIRSHNEAPDVRDYFELGLELLLDELEKGAAHPEVAMLWERLHQKRQETIDAQFARIRTKTQK